ncbi:MAG: glycoside hydrolase family 127 protein [Oscillospiraceae bacterium]|nr:glycoside hydrolase family 127 protein [Oscillospiraceae bacterium]
MSKKLTVGKLLGIIFCILAAAGAVVLLWANAYFGGQMKLIDKYYTALARNDFEGFKTCLGEEMREIIDEEMFFVERNGLYVNLYGYKDANEMVVHSLLLSLQDDEDVPVEKDIHTEVKFVSREKFYDEYIVYFDLTVYNDEEHKETQSSLPLIRNGGKWVIG